MKAQRATRGIWLGRKLRLIRVGTRPRQAVALLPIAIAAVAAAAGPLLAGMALFQGDPSSSERHRMLGTSAQTLAAAIDAEIARHATVLAALAASPVLDRPAADLRDLDAHARAVATVLGTPVTIADTSLAQLTNSAVVYGTPLPSLDNSSTALQALESRTVAISGQPTVADDERPAITIAVPARRDGQNVAVLTTQIEASNLGRVLSDMVRDGIVAALADRSGHIIASTAQSPGLGFHSPLNRTGALIFPAEAGVETTENGTPVDYAVRTLHTMPDWTVVAVTPQPAGSIWQVSPSSLVGAGLAALVTLLATGFALRRERRNSRQTALESEAEALRTLAELKALHDTIPVGLALLNRELRFLSVNAKLAGVSGVPVIDHIGRHPSDVLPFSIAAPVEDAHGRVLTTGRPVLEFPLSGEAPGTVRNIRQLLASCHPVRDREGRISGVSLVLQDVTERVRAEKGRELLLRELNHRVKNTLATVQAIISITLRRTDSDPQQLNAELGARIRALAYAHDLLTAHSWEDADLVDVARAALNPWLGSTLKRVTIDGPPGVLLRPRQAQAVVLALHELATNATKHGALSQDEGRICLGWSTKAGGLTTMEWVEIGGPTVIEPPPEKRGFGTRLLERALAADLGAGTEVQLIFAPEGLRARIAFIGVVRATGVEVCAPSISRFPDAIPSD